MAELITSTSRRGPAPIKVDMTPLVDLAFLLLSFFILTTTLRRLEGIELARGAGLRGRDGTSTITLLVSGRDRIHGYAGPFDPDSTHIRRYGLDQVRAALHAVQDTADFKCIIRAEPKASYQAVVDVLDQAAFLGPAHYTVEEGLSSAEETAVQQVEALQ